jgi:hypothetical protein
VTTDDPYAQPPRWDDPHYGGPEPDPAAYWGEAPYGAQPPAPGPGSAPDWGATGQPGDGWQAQPAGAAPWAEAPRQSAAPGASWPEGWTAGPEIGTPVAGGLPWGEGTSFSRMAQEHGSGPGVTLPQEVPAAPGGPQVGLPWGEEAAAAVGAQLDEAGYVWGGREYPAYPTDGQRPDGGGEFAWGPVSPARDPEPGAPVGAAAATATATGFAFASAGTPGPGPAAATTAALAPPPNAARTGSPIIDPGLESAAGTLLLAVLLSGTAALGRPALAVGVAVLQAVTAAGWFRLNGMWPARQGILLAFLGGLVADAAALFAAGGGAGPGALLGTLGAFFLLVLVLQVFRPSDPQERFHALTVSASATAVTVLAGGFLAALSTANGKYTVVVGALAAAFSAIFAALTARALPGKAAFAVGWVVALAAGIGLASAAGIGAGPGALLGAVAGGCGLLGRRVAAFDFPSRFVHRTAGVALPLACAAPLVLFLGSLG